MSEHRHGIFPDYGTRNAKLYEVIRFTSCYACTCFRSSMKTDGHGIDTGLTESMDLLEQHSTDRLPEMQATTRSRHLGISCPQQNGGITAMVHWPVDILIRPSQLPRRHSCPRLTERCRRIHAVADPKSASLGLDRVPKGRRSCGRNEKMQERQIHHRGGYQKFSFEVN
jgi:hypothetical protein